MYDALVQIKIEMNLEQKDGMALTCYPKYGSVGRIKLQDTQGFILGPFLKATVQLKLHCSIELPLMRPHTTAGGSISSQIPLSLRVKLPCEMRLLHTDVLCHEKSASHNRRSTQNTIAQTQTCHYIHWYPCVRL